MAEDFTDIKAIFFDTSDTLYKNEALEAAYPQKLVELIAATRDISNDAAKLLLKETSEQLKGQVKHVTKVRAMAELGFSRTQVHKAFCRVRPQAYLREDATLRAILSELTQHYQLGIISNLKRSHMLEILQALGLSSNLFPLLVTEDIVTEIKPDPEPFLTAIRLAKCSPGECLYVGDSPTKDMRPAKQVGMKTVLIADSCTDEDMQYVDARISDVKDIAGLLQ
jgi:HAD superfamily hydrolase (TIGR01549 family)